MFIDKNKVPGNIKAHTSDGLALCGRGPHHGTITILEEQIPFPGEV
jgi:hypothetical protein